MAVVFSTWPKISRSRSKNGFASGGAVSGFSGGMRDMGPPVGPRGVHGILSTGRPAGQNSASKSGHTSSLLTQVAPDKVQLRSAPGNRSEGPGRATKLGRCYHRSDLNQAEGRDGEPK